MANAQSTKHVLRPVRVSGMVTNAFYVRERDLNEEQIKFIKNHSLFMKGYSAEEKMQMNTILAALFDEAKAKRAGNTKPGLKRVKVTIKIKKFLKGGGTKC